MPPSLDGGSVWVPGLSEWFVLCPLGDSCIFKPLGFVFGLSFPFGPAGKVASPIVGCVVVLAFWRRARRRHRPPSLDGRASGEAEAQASVARRVPRAL